MPICLILIFAGILHAQTLSPKTAFKDDPQSHNMHLASDGKFLYTCNGGKAELGQITKFRLDGTKIASYKIKLDMRSLMYNKSDGNFYVNTYNHKFYKINDLKLGSYSEIYDFADRNEQSVPALSANGKEIYFMESGDVFIYSLKKGRLISTFSGLRTPGNAADGGTTIAVNKKHIYTWNAGEQTVNVYDINGKFQKSVKLSQGNYGFSLSFANGMLWVSADGNYDEGTWYGYVIK